MEIPSQAIKNLVGTDYGYTFDQVNFNTLVFHDGIKRLDKSDYDAEIIRLQAEFIANAYARSRASSYPSVGEQLDMMMKDKRDGTTTHQTACELVKSTYPKG